MKKYFSFPVYKLEIKYHIRSMMIWGGVLSGVILLIMAFFPAMQNQAMLDLAGAKLSGIPDSVLAVLGLSRGALDLTDVFFFFSYVMQFVNMALAVLAAQIGTGALIREETDGSIEFLYAQPITRGHILFSKALAAFSLLAMLKLLLIIVSLLAFLIFGGNPNLGEALQKILSIFGGTLFAELVFLSVGFFCSVLIKSSKRISSLSIAIVFGTFLVGIMSILSDSLEFLLYLSPLDTVKPNLIINNNTDTGGFIVGACVIIASFILSAVLYKKKDFCL